MANLSEQKYRAWDKKRKKMRTVSIVSFDKKYVIFKDSPADKVPFDDIELLRHSGIASSNRKGIYEGDIISFNEGDDTRIGVVMRSDKGDFLFQLRKTAKEVSFPWNQRDIKVLGNRFENAFYLSDEYERMVHIGHIQDVLSSDNICMDKYCRHDLEKAVASLQDLNKEELVEMVKSLAESLRYYTKAYFDERLNNRRR